MKLIKQIEQGISLVQMPNGQVKFAIHGVFGEGSTRAYENGESLSQIDSIDGTSVIDTVDTEAEARAFWKGVIIMDGYSRYEATDLERHQALKVGDGIIEATYVSVINRYKKVTFACKVNLATKFVIDIEVTTNVDDIGHVDSEYIELSDGTKIHDFETEDGRKIVNGREVEFESSIQNLL